MTQAGSADTFKMSIPDLKECSVTVDNPSEISGKEQAATEGLCLQCGSDFRQGQMTAQSAHTDRFFPG